MNKRLIVILLLVLTTCITIILICGSGDPIGGGADLSDPKYDLYYECTARQREGGYSIVDAAARCATLKPK